MNMQLSPSAFVAAPPVKTVSEIGIHVFDLLRRAEVMMKLIESFEDRMELAQQRGLLNGIAVEFCNFDLVAFQANEVREGLRLLESSMEAIGAS